MHGQQALYLIGLALGDQPRPNEVSSLRYRQVPQRFPHESDYTGDEVLISWPTGKPCRVHLDALKYVGATAEELCEWLASKGAKVR